MEYLGHTQSANYTFGPWRSNAFRSAPAVFLPAVQKQQSGSGGVTFSQQQQPALNRSHTAIDTYRKQSPTGATINGSTAVNGCSWPAMATMDTARGCQRVGFDSSYRPATAANEYSVWPLNRTPATLSGDRYGSPLGSMSARQPATVDWLSRTSTELRAADRVRSGSELIRADVLTLCRDACDRTRKTQADTTRRIGDRANDVQFWRDEVRKESDMAATESRAMQRAIGSLERALGETAAPLHIAEECLRLRQEKIGGDLIHDGVERELIKEIEGIRQCQEEMSSMLAEVKNLAESSKKSHFDLACDMADKQEALRLDKASFQLRQSSQGLQRLNGIDGIDSTVTDPDSWIRHTNELVAKSQTDRSNSADARNRIAQLMDKCATSLTNQWNAVNAALNDNIQDYTDARSKLHTQLSKVLEETVQVEKSGGLLAKCIRDKEAPLMLAHTRLATRVPRPNMEACRDLAQHRLVNEVHEIGDTVEELRSKMKDVEQTMNNLCLTRSSLECDLNIKNNAIHVDRDMVLSLRKSYDMCPKRTVTY